MTAPGNKALVERYYEDIWNAGNVAAADEILSSTFTFYPPDAPEGLRGRATYKAYVELHRRAFPDLRPTVMDVLAEGDRVAVQWAMQGTHHGAFGSVMPTGAEVIVRGMDLVHIAGGRIVALHSYFDLLTVVHQLRAHPVRGSTSAPGMLGPRSPRRSRRE
jgi:steroid delta-isomerase-like uncharacterized protein